MLYNVQEKVTDVIARTGEALCQKIMDDTEIKTICDRYARDIIPLGLTADVDGNDEYWNLYVEMQYRIVIQALIHLFPQRIR